MSDENNNKETVERRKGQRRVCVRALSHQNVIKMCENNDGKMSP